MSSRSVEAASDSDVTAVLVCHDGERWLSAALAALARQSRPPDRVVAVDTGSRDATRRLVAEALGPQAVCTAPATTGFGAAVQVGLDSLAGRQPRPAADGAGRAVSWVWLLHDDCAPAPDALERLLAGAAGPPRAGVVGPKVRDWYRPEVLLEIGLTTDRAGHRYTGLDPREVDQGQHDDVRDVLAVGSAGALVRRDVWDALGGFDPRLPLFRDDLDFGWRAARAGHHVAVASDAVVWHAQAGARGLRRLAATANHPRRVDRRHGLYTVLVNVPAPVAATLAAVLAVGALLRAVTFVLTRRPRLALDEVAAYVGMLARLPALVAGRWARARGAPRPVGNRALAGLLPRPAARLVAALDSALGAALDVRPDVVRERRARGERASSPARVPWSWRRRLFRSPALYLAVVLAAVAAVAERRLLGSGELVGGRLLPQPDGASDLWRAYLASWHPVGLGGTSAAPPYLALLAAVATLLFGKVWLAVDVLLLAAVPLAGLSAYVALRHLRPGRLLRAWAAAVYALLPVGAAAVGGGRIGVAVAFVLVPQVVAAAARGLDDAWRGRGLRRAWLAALPLAAAAAFAPESYPLAVLALAAAVCAALAVALARRTGRGGPSRGRSAVAAARVGVASVVTAAAAAGLLVPWTVSLWGHRSPLVLGVGYLGAEPAGRPPSPSRALLAWPGGPGMPPAWLLVPLVLAALAATVRRDRVGSPLAWALVGAAVGVGLFDAHATAAPVSGGPPVAGWGGAASAVVGAGLVVAAVLGGGGARGRLGSLSFGWRQLTATVLAVAAAAVPVAAAAGWLVRGTPGPVERAPAGQVLPAFVTEDLAGSPGLRALVLARGRDGVVGYAFGGDSAATLATADVRPAPAGSRRLEAVVHDLAGGLGGAAADLAGMGVRYVVATGATGTRLADALDEQPGLARSTAGGAVAVWRVVPPTGGLALLAPSTASAAERGRRAEVDALVADPARALPLRGDRTRVAIPAGPDGRLLVVATPRDPHWRASLDGRPLPARTAWGWAQAFAVPPGGGRLVVEHTDGWRGAGLWFELGFLVLVGVFAAPTVRRPEPPIPATAPDPVTSAAHEPAARAQPAGTAPGGGR